VVTTFTSAVPIVPARDTESATGWYRDNLGFEVRHVEPEYGIVCRDEVYIHFWGPSGVDPHESMYMFRVGVDAIEELYEHCGSKKIVHPNAPLREQPWGSIEFAISDGDGNLLTFFESKTA